MRKWQVLKPQYLKPPSVGHDDNIDRAPKNCLETFWKKGVTKVSMKSQFNFKLTKWNKCQL